MLRLIVVHKRPAESPVVAKAYATIPSVNMWDDHVGNSCRAIYMSRYTASYISLLVQDIIDGYGSYPADLQKSNCFQGLLSNVHFTTIT